MKNDLRLLVLNDFAYTEGGAAQVGLYSALAMAQQGHDVTIFSAVGPVAPELSAYRDLRVVCTNQYDILREPNRLRAATQGVWNLRAARMFSKVLDSYDTRNTIVHVHTWTKALSSSPIREALKRGFQVVLTMHDYFTACPNGAFFNYPLNQICRLRGMSTECLRTNCDSRSYPQKLWRVSRQAAQKEFGPVPDGIKHFIAISRFSYEVLKSYLPAEASVYFVSNPIEVSKQEPAKVHENTGFIAVGRLAKEKGPRLLAEAAGKLGATAVFAGDGESRELVQESNPDAIITGWIDRRSVQAHLREARALVFPSLWYEAQPLVPYEAAALGIPAIISDSCAAKDMIEDGVTGLLFKSGSVDDLMDKMTVLRDPEAARKMGAATYERYWADPPTMESHIARLEEVYTHILQ